MTTPMDPQPAERPRYHYIDWLRVIATFLLIPVHTCLIFSLSLPYFVKNDQMSRILTFLGLASLYPWQMPLLFLLAGMSTWFALGHRSNGAFLKERGLRLLVPFFFGLLVLVPPTAYYGLRNATPYSGSLLQFYPLFFRFQGEMMGFTGGFTFGHMWFVLFLLGYSALALPLFRYLRGQAGARILSRLAGLFSKPGAIFLLAIPLAISESIRFVGELLPMASYLLLFLFGYFLMSDARLQEALERHRWIALIAGLPVGVGGMVVWYLQGLPSPPWPLRGIGVLFAILRNLTTWTWIVAMLGFARRYLNRENGLLRYAREASYPYYILHQTVLVSIGFYVVRLNLSIALKYLILCTGAIAATVGLYDLVAKRTNVTRLLLGMKLRRRAEA